MEYTLKIPDSKIEEVLLAQFEQQVRNRISNHSDAMRTAVDAAIRAAVQEAASKIDIQSAVKPLIDSVFDRVLKDAVYRQIKDIVRLAVQKELAVQRASVSVDSEI